MTGPDCAALLAEVRTIRRELNEVRLEFARQRPARDTDEAELVATIVAAVGSRTFLSDDLVKAALTLDTPSGRALHRELDRRRALTPRRCGKLLAALEGRDFGGVVVSTVKAEAPGLVWKLVGFEADLAVSNPTTVSQSIPSSAIVSS
jgi:hypothetical protein